MPPRRAVSGGLSEAERSAVDALRNLRRQATAALSDEQHPARHDQTLVPTGLDLPEGWKGAFLAALGRGDTIEQAAGAAEIGVSTAYAQKTRDLEFAAEWEAAKRIRSERRRDWVIDKLHAIAESDDHKAQFAALAKLFDALPENRSRDLNVGFTPPPQAIEGRRPVGLADVFRLAHDLGIRVAVGVDATGPRPALPAAPDVLPEPPDG